MSTTRVRSLANVVEAAFRRRLPRTRVRVVPRDRLARVLVAGGVPRDAAMHATALTTPRGTILVAPGAGGRTLLHELVHRMGRPGSIHAWVDEAVTEAAAAELAELAAQRWPAHASWIRRGTGYGAEVAWLRARVLDRLGVTAVDLSRALTGSRAAPILLATRLVTADPTLDHAALVRALQARPCAPRARCWAPPRGL